MQCICPGHLKRSSRRGQFLVTLSKTLGWGPEPKGIVGTNVVVDVFPLPRGRAELLEIKLPHIAIVEPLRMGSPGPLHVSIQLGRTWRQGEQSQRRFLPLLRHRGPRGHSRLARVN